MKHNLRSHVLEITGLLVATLISACQPVQPVAPATDADADASNVVIEITATGLNVPAEIPAGIVTVTFQNNSESQSAPSLGWLAEGATFEEFESAMASDDFPAIIQMAIPVGGPELEPGESEDVTFELKAGDILVVNFPEEAAPQIARTIATENGVEMAAPVADFKVDMDEFSFTMPDEMQAGPRLWEINNVGEQWHEFIIFKPEEGATLEQLVELAMLEEEPEGPIPFEEVGFFSSMGSNTKAWATFDLPAGEYYVVCFLPDIEDEAMTSHVAHGMVRTLIVK